MVFAIEGMRLWYRIQGSAAVSSTYGSRRMMRMTAVNSVADGCRTMTFSTKRHNVQPVT